MKSKTITILVLIIIAIISISNVTYASGHTAGEVLDEAEGFIQKGQSGANDIINEDELKTLANTIYNILLVVAIVIAVILGAILGIKFMTEGVEGKAKVTQSLIPYAIGCVVVFGAFTIWKIVVTVLQGMN